MARLTTVTYLRRPCSNRPRPRSVPWENVEPSDKLGPEQRAAAIERLRSSHLDILVIGGGVTGTASALDAAARGLNVALVEQSDLASGTSSRSSKLVHGGLRYLEQRDFTLVHEALRERRVLLNTVAPHLVRPLPFLLPVPGRPWRRFYYGAGVLLYDMLAAASRSNVVPWHKHVSVSKAIEMFPSLKRGAFSGAIVYYDAQLDDARHTMAVARTAVKHGAAVATSVKVTELVTEAGAVVGAELLDQETGETWQARARCVVNATGVWSEQIQEMSGSSDISIRAAKGVHIVVPRHCIDGDAAIILQTKISVLLAIPWGEHWLIGTTDTPWHGDLARPTANRSDIDYILEQLNVALERPVNESDIVGVYAGLRPLVDTKADSTAKISREHLVSSSPGLVTIAGGKYTTYRVMAADTVDAAAAALGTVVPESRTEQIPLVGSQDWDEWSGKAGELATKYDLDIDVVERLLGRFGSSVAELLDVMAEDPEQLSQPVPGGGYILAEVVYAARFEGALHVDDVLARRLRLNMEAADRGVAAAPVVARLMGQELGWDEARITSEAEAWQSQIQAERAANAAVDDDGAGAERNKAPIFRQLPNG